MSICPKNKSSKGRRDRRRANWKMTAPTLVPCSKCGELMIPHRVCKGGGCPLLQQYLEYGAGPEYPVHHWRHTDYLPVRQIRQEPGTEFQHPSQEESLMV